MILRPEKQLGRDDRLTGECHVLEAIGRDGEPNGLDFTFFGPSHHFCEVGHLPDR